MKTIKKYGLILLFFCLPVYSFAWWGVLGHRIVGQIADSYLTAKARAEIKKILGDESIAMSANWADFIYSDSTYNDLKPWHYINLDSGLTTAYLRNYLKHDSTADVYTKLNFLIKELKNKNLRADKRKMYLKLLIHFVGDAHQPMHTARRNDYGGNRIKVTWFNNPTNLHAVWDESLVNFQQLSYTEYATAINHTTLQQRKQLQAQPISEWIIESYQIAQIIYAGVTEPSPKFSYDYNFKYVKTVNERLLKGGVRLAGILNSIFK